MTDREERMEEALLRIKRWAEAYPVTTFKPLEDHDLKLAARVLVNSGIDMGALHAGWARHILDGITKICEEGLKK